MRKVTKARNENHKAFLVSRRTTSALFSSENIHRNTQSSSAETETFIQFFPVNSLYLFRTAAGASLLNILIAVGSQATNFLMGLARRSLITDHASRSTNLSF